MIVPHPGIRVWTNEHGATVLRLHYEADPDKSAGKKVYVEKVKRWLTPWAAEQCTSQTDPSLYLQEYEVEFKATLGQLVYLLDDEATLEKSFPIPADWTRVMCLDPHISVPHASLWGAVDRFGDIWFYRELWPSKIYGKDGKQPADDNRYTIKDYVESMAWMESADNPQNCLLNGKPEKVFTRVIDYAARGFGKESDSPEALNYQQRFEDAMTAAGMWNPRFEDCDKNRGVGEALVNEWLKPRQVEDVTSGTWISKSKVHIFEDCCPELIWELKNNRREQLSAEQADKRDPTGKALDIRKHMTDNLLYIVASNPTYRRPSTPRGQFESVYEGIAY